MNISWRIKISAIVLYLIGIGLMVYLCWSSYHRSQSAWDHWEAALNFFKESKYREAIGELNKVESVDANFPSIHLDRGGYYVFLGQYRDAINDFNEEVKLCRYPGSGLVDRGEAYAEWGKYQEALNDFNKMLIIEPQESAALRGRGVVYACQGKYDDAIKDFVHTQSVLPKFINVRNSLAGVYSKIGNYQAALDEFNKSINGQYDIDDALNGRGIVYEKQGRYKDAIKDFSNVIGPLNQPGVELDSITASQLGRACYYRAIAYEKLGMTQLAKKDRQKVKHLGYGPSMIRQNVVNDLVFFDQ